MSDDCHDRFRHDVRAIAAADTAARPDEWSPNEPLLMHCTLVALLAQELFGGDIMRADLRAVPGFESVRWHSWNRLLDGQEIDFTDFMVQRPLPDSVIHETRTREEILSYAGIKERYDLFRSRYARLSPLGMEA